MNNGTVRPRDKASINQPADLAWIREILDAGYRLCVRLNGEEQKRVTSYNRFEGWVERQKLRDGRPYTEDNKTVAIERVHGEVTVSLVLAKP